MQTTSRAASDGTADWNQITEEVSCVRCGYNLRGLDTPRCPECGLGFTWEEVINPDLRPHRYLYEHHFGKEKFRRILKTVVHSWIPWRFWRSMALSRPRPVILTAYVFWIVFIGTILAFLMSAGVFAVDIETTRRIHGTRPLSWIEASREGWRSTPMGARKWLGAIAVVHGPLVLFTVASLSVFSRRLRQCRVQAGHLWRVAIYSATGNAALVLLFGSVLFKPFIVILWQIRMMGNGQERVLPPLIVAAVLSLLVVGHWIVSLLAAGYLYLRIKGWWVVALCSQIITGLALLVIWVLLILATSPW